MLVSIHYYIDNVDRKIAQGKLSKGKQTVFHKIYDYVSTVIMPIMARLSDVVGSIQRIKNFCFL
jgi:hypothetical protein